MNRSQLGHLLRLAFAMPRHLRRPMTATAAREILGHQLAKRQENFLAAARRLIYENETSPYRKLLLWTGCSFRDLERSVEARGLEDTLCDLRDLGVFVTFEEFRGKVPISRPGITIETRESAFDNPAAAPARALSGTTSGRRFPAARVLYDWSFITEEAAHELLLYEHHGVLDAPTALWYPVLPGVAGLHNLLISLVMGRPPHRWFSQTDPATLGYLSLLRVALLGVRFGGWLGGQRVPCAEFADFENVDRILLWLEALRKKGAQRVLRTFVSSALRLTERGKELGIELAGTTIFAGGEPMGEVRRRLLESTGVRVVCRYVATEPGLIAAACDHCERPDEMHVYSDRLAVVPKQGRGGDNRGRREELLFTSLTLHAGKVLLNTDIGDAGALSSRPCSCPLGELGFDLRISGVGTNQRVTVEGMSVTCWELEEAVEKALARAGIGPGRYRYWVERNERGLEQMIVALKAGGLALDADAFAAMVYSSLEQGTSAAKLAASVWRQAGALRVSRVGAQEKWGAKFTPLAPGPIVGGQQG